MAELESKIDSLNRRKRIEPQSTGKRITPTERDMLWFQKIHEHGPLPSSYLHAFSKHLWKSEKKAKERLTDLFNEDNTPHRGTYLKRPSKQFETIDARYKELVYDLSVASTRALKEAELWSDYGREKSGPWWHSYMVSCITASIEIDTRTRDDVNYVPGSAILKRAEAQLRYPTTITWPGSSKPLLKDLIPDALFGLEYVKDGQTSYRFYMVEADKGTEPAITSNPNRKSYQRHVLQYREYVGRGLYKEHLKLSAPLMVLNVFSDQQKSDQMLNVLNAAAGSSNYHLFQVFDNMQSPLRMTTNIPNLIELN